jgi:hypothetical protein
VTTTARGTFEVKLNPLATHDTTAGSPLGRFSIDKQFHGDIEGTSIGEMLSGGTPVKGSAAYVAIERVTGTLAGRAGSFILQHTGVMHRGAGSLVVAVVPDSGTEALSGLTGTLSIRIENGKHYYELEYALAPTP